MKILVTGSSGMIGTAFNEKYGEYVVLNVDKKKPGLDGSQMDVSNFCLADLADFQQAHKAFTSVDFDVCLHLAANARVWETTVDPPQAFENMASAFNVIELCRALKKPLVFASSREVFGNEPFADEFAKHYYTSPYAVSKGYAERLLQVYENLYGLKSIVIRYSNVFGRHDYSNRVIPVWIRRMLRNEPVFLFGEKKAFNFTYIDDAVDITFSLIKRLGVDAGNFNVGGKRVFLVFLYHLLKRYTDSTSELIVTDSRPGEPVSSNIVSKRLEWVYQDFKRALKKTVDWYRENDRYEKVSDYSEEDLPSVVESGSSSGQ